MVTAIVLDIQPYVTRPKEFESAWYSFLYLSFLNPMNDTRTYGKLEISGKDVEEGQKDLAFFLFGDVI